MRLPSFSKGLGCFFRIALNNGLVTEFQQEKENPHQGTIYSRDG